MWTRGAQVESGVPVTGVRASESVGFPQGQGSTPPMGGSRSQAFYLAPGPASRVEQLAKVGGMLQRLAKECRWYVVLTPDIVSLPTNAK